MNDPGFPFDESEAGPARYRASGWFDFLPLTFGLALSAALALAMACVLSLLEEDYYYFFITPLIVGAPVFGATWATVRLSHCRNVALGSVVGIALCALYYAGFWEVSYLRNVVRRGPFAVRMVEMVGGAPGLPGYVAFRCKTSVPVAAHGGAPANPRDPTAADMAFNGFFFGLEALTILGVGLAVGGSAAGRAYYERQRRWASVFEFRVPPSGLPTVLEAIEKGDWAAIAALPRVSSQGNANSNGVLFRVEYLPGASGEPFYLTVKPPGLGRRQARRARAEGRPVEVKQRAIPAESGRALAEHFPDLAAKVAVAEAAGPSDPTAARPEAPGGLRAAIAKGLAGAGGSGDFRDKAVAASDDLFESAGEDGADASWCVPVEGATRRSVRSAAWWKIKLQVAAFATFFGGLLVAAWAESQAKAGAGPLGPAGWRALIWAGGGVAIAFAVVSLWLVFDADRVQRWRLKSRLRRREGSLLDYADGLPTRLLRVEDARTHHVAKMAPEDLAIVVFDKPNRRLLLEGVSHRYLIRADDVATLWPLQSGAVVSVQIAYRIGPETLALVLSADNPMFHLFHGAFAHRGLKSLVKKLVETFGREFPDAERPPVKGVSA